MKNHALLLLSFVFYLQIQAQNVAINSSGNSGNAAAILDLSDASNNNLGLALPNVSIVNINSGNPIIAPPTGLIVYNTNAATVGGLGVGFYYWSGVAWLYIQNSGSTTSWQITGNTGTSPGTNFIGTTDAEALEFKVDGQKAGWIDYNDPFDNTSIGYLTLNVNTGGNNSAFGFQALQNNTTGNANIAMGTNTLNSNTSGWFNTAYGESTLFSNTTGFHNTATGGQALYSNVTASSNTALGFNAGYSNTGDANVFIGDSAGPANTSATGGTFVGYMAGPSNTTGSNNTAIGNATLTSNFTGTNLTAIGYQANVNADGYNNSTAIGNGAIIGQSNSIILGNSVARTGIQTSTPQQAFEIGGSNNTIRIDGLQFGNAFNTSPTAITTYILYANTNGDIYAMPAAGGLGNVLAWTPSGPAWGSLPAGAITANNGLTISGGNNVQLGGSLVSATTITQAGNSLDISGGTISLNDGASTTTTNINTGTSTGPVNVGNGTNTTITEAGNISLNANNNTATTSIGTGTTTGAVTIGGSTNTVNLPGMSTTNGILYTSTAGGQVAQTAALTNGQVLIGSTGNPPVPATITPAGNSGISVSNGAGSITLATNGVLNTITVITNPTVTYTPSAGTKAIMVELIGGGGGGGSSSAPNTNGSAGGGGGAGGYVKFYISNPAGPYTVAVGTGGSAGAAAATHAGNGGAGGGGTATTFQGGYLAGGGSGGAIGSANVSGAGGNGGSASGGLINVTGSPGGPGTGGFANGAVSGIGGSSVLGGGAFPASELTNNSSITGNAGSANSGGGGSGCATLGGGASNEIATTGGAGANGIIIITEYK